MEKNMQIIGAFEAKTHFSALLEQVAQGDEITISRRGKPIARVVLIENKDNKSQAKEAAQQMREFASKNKLSIDWQEWKQFRGEGRS